MSNSLQPHGLQPARLLYPWNSAGRNTGVGSRTLLQGIPSRKPYPSDPGNEPRYPTWQADSLQSEPQGKPHTEYGGS